MGMTPLGGEKVVGLLRGKRGEQLQFVGGKECLLRVEFRWIDGAVLDVGPQGLPQLVRGFGVITSESVFFEHGNDFIAAEPIDGLMDVLIRVLLLRMSWDGAYHVDGANKGLGFRCICDGLDLLRLPELQTGAPFGDGCCGVSYASRCRLGSWYWPVL